MSASAARELIAKIGQKLAEKPEQARAIGGKFRFDLDGDGGSWLMNLADSVGITETSDDADCAIQLSSSDFVDLLEGRASGQQLFFAGKLRVDGDITMALRLQQLPDLLK